MRRQKKIAEVGEKFFKQGWLFYCPTPVWLAWQARLLGSAHLSPSPKMIPREALFGILDSSFPHCREECGSHRFYTTHRLPEPTVTNPDEWREVFDRFDLSGGGPVAIDGNRVLVVRFVPMTLEPLCGHGRAPNTSWNDVSDYETRERLQKEFGITRAKMRTLRSLRPGLVVAIHSYTTNTTPKLRRSRILRRVKNARSAELLKIARLLDME